MSSKLSETYQQLSSIFKCLENNSFHEGADFGENLTGCFRWFLSPPAVIFLEKQNPAGWYDIKRNEKFILKGESWTGYKSQGVDINLVL